MYYELFPYSELFADKMKSLLGFRIEHYSHFKFQNPAVISRAEDQLRVPYLGLTALRAPKILSMWVSIA